MQEQKLSHGLRNSSSESLCLKMGIDDSFTDNCRKLGLKEMRKGVLGVPRFLSLLSSVLENSVKKNEVLLETAQIKDIFSEFHGSRAPPVSIKQYIDRIFKYAGCSSSCFIVAYIYVNKYLQETDAFLTSLNVHRLLVTSVMVATKFFDDAFFNNAYYAKVAGVSTPEMNRLEMTLLFSLDFRLQINTETFRSYCLLLEKKAGGSQIDRPIKFKSCWFQESRSRKDNSPCRTPIAR